MFRPFSTKETTVADRYSLRSYIHVNLTHELSLSLTNELSFTSALWLSKTEVAPPMSMLFQLIRMVPETIKKLQGGGNFRRMLTFPKERQNFCQKVWTKAENLKKRRHTHRNRQQSISNAKNWKREFFDEHKKCRDTACRNKNHRKCMNFAREYLARREKKVTLQDCTFPVTLTNPFHDLIRHQRRRKRKQLKKTSKCWKLTRQNDINRCLKRNRKQCKLKLRGKKNWQNDSKIIGECRSRQKIEKCMVEHRKFLRKHRKSKKWDRRKSRQICKRRQKHQRQRRLMKRP